MRTRYPFTGRKCSILAFVVVVLLPLPAIASSSSSNAPGVLPWGLPQAAKEKPKKESNGKNGHKNGGRRGRIQRKSAPAARSGGLVESLGGMAYLGFETAGGAQNGPAIRTGANFLGLDLRERGSLIDPRLWNHSLGVQMDRSAFNAPLQSSATNGLGIDFNGTLFGSRSFPLQVFFNRHSANTNFTGPGDTRTNVRNLGLSWSLHQPKLVNITLNAQLGKTSTEATSAFLPFQERQQSLALGVNRSFLGWDLSGFADYSRVGSSLEEFQYILRGQEVRAQHSLGNRGEFSSTLHHMLRTESQQMRPSSRYDLTNLLNTLTYRHTEKLHGYYGASYISNIREAAIVSALRSSTGAGGTPTEPNPAFQQALLATTGTSSFNALAGWNYAVTTRLQLDMDVGYSILDTPEVPAESRRDLLKGYTTVGGGISYNRRFGGWETNWRGGLQHHWNRRLVGGGYGDDNLSAGMGVSRRLGRWNWMSQFAFSDYSSGRGVGSLYRQERWGNTLETRLTKRVRFNLGAELTHINSNFAANQFFNRNNEDGLLFHGTFTNRTWTVTMGHGLRNVNSAFLSLDLANPLNSALLSQVSPLISPLMNADRYTYLTGDYRVSRKLSFRGAYRRDNFLLSLGDFNRYADMDLSLDYRLRRLTVTAGYRRLNLETLTGSLNRDMFYVRVGRPFRIF